MHLLCPLDTMHSEYTSDIQYTEIILYCTYLKKLWVVALK